MKQPNRPIYKMQSMLLLWLLAKGNSEKVPLFYRYIRIVYLGRSFAALNSYLMPVSILLLLNLHFIGNENLGDLHSLKFDLGYNDSKYCSIRTRASAFWSWLDNLLDIDQGDAFLLK